MSMWTMDERRITPRLVSQQSVLLRNRVSAAFCEARVVDVSAKGICVVSESMPKNSEDVVVSVQHPTTNSWLPELLGKVIWTRNIGRNSEFPYMGGILFDEMHQNFNHWGDAYMSLKKFENRDVKKNVKIPTAYDGSTSTFKVLRAFGWGPLVNLGYYRLPVPLTLLEMATSIMTFRLNSFVPNAQNRLALKTLREVNIQRGDEVLDVACGRGRSSFLAASLNRATRITGIDLLEPNITTARTLYGGMRNIKFFVDDALNLSFANESFHKVYCLEAAFHFPDRSQFLREAYRVLKPGGRLVVVDFMWKSAEARNKMNDPRADLVKEIWKFDDFWSTQEYKDSAESVGFHIERMRDWTMNVTTPAIFLLNVIGLTGSTAVGRAALSYLNPLVRGLNKNMWGTFHESAKAHAFVEPEAKYIALSAIKK